MKKLLFLTLLLSAVTIYANDSKTEWTNTELTDATIKKIQEAQFQYKKCVAEEMQKPAYKDIDTRKATDQVIKQCEPVLAKMREVYIGEKVPGAIADRHLKQMRIRVTRSALQELMFSEAARKSGQ
ncbi:MAG: hypothetical protein HOP23_13795 [Methylococcaceae bacterium]|nr:hypothetical protein [Methylococcaceae bacterium]